MQIAEVTIGYRELTDKTVLQFSLTIELRKCKSYRKNQQDATV
jgi:hypothetical protein